MVGWVVTGGKVKGGNVKEDPGGTRMHMLSNIPSLYQDECIVLSMKFNAC